MIALISLAIVKPPEFGLPALLDGFPGWFVGFVILVAPTVVLTLRSHRRLGHWQRYFAYWRRRSWWAITLGSLGAALSALGLLGAIPAWNRAWLRWNVIALAQAAPNPQTLHWLNQSQEQFALLLQSVAAVTLVGSLALTLLGMVIFLRRILIRRALPLPSPDWIMEAPLQ